MLSRYDRLVTEDRLRVYSYILIGFYLCFFTGWILASRNGVDPGGVPIGADFTQFYAAARMALDGLAADAFSAQKLQAATSALFPDSDNDFLWNYPPTFLLVLAPFGLLPYFVALAAFMLATLGLFLWAARTLVPNRLTVFAALAFGGTFQTILHGQNGFLATAALAIGFLLLPRRPIVAGLMFGCVSYKPHLGVLLPLLLLAAGQWRAFAAATVSALVLAGVSVVLFSLEAWTAFFRNLPEIAAIVRDSPEIWPKMPSVFATMRLIGASGQLAFGVQAVVSACIATATLWAWSKPGPSECKAALAVLATLLVSPYLLDYDLVLLGIPVALMAQRALRTGRRDGDAILVLAAIAPLLCCLVATTRLPLLIMCGFYAVVWFELARARREDGGEVPLPATDSPATAAR